MVAVGSWLTKSRSTDWDKPLNVVVYAINADASAASQKYIDELKNTDFLDIEEFFQREAAKYKLPLKKPVDVSYAGQLNEKPPFPPNRGSRLSIIFWSLKLRYWAWNNDNYPYPEDAQIFVQYFDPKKIKAVEHSLGLQKGLIGIVNAFASDEMKKENHVIITHELLHTVGAIDKYDPNTNRPLYPIGYADSEQTPLHPQKKAEIMAGRIAVAENEAKQPEELKQVVLGESTAYEIQWITELVHF
jgi:hypothetical protein